MGPGLEMTVQRQMVVTERILTNGGAAPALLDLFARHERFFVTSHARPDGDALGSALGLMHLLDGMGKEVRVAFADPVPDAYAWLPGMERIEHVLPEEAPEVAILLECGSVERTGFDPACFAEMGDAVMVNIDHHLSGRPFAEVNWIDDKACAVGAMLYDLAVASGREITAARATCLYAAVLTDTGSFTYAGTVESTFALARHLVERGANANEVARHVYFSNPASKVRALGIALATMQIEDGIAWAWILEEGMDRAGAVVEDCEGIVQYLIGIAGVKAAIFLREMPGGEEFRLSLRSKGGVDVAQVAERFGGGGHRNASGCTVAGPLDAAIVRVLAELRR